MTDGHMIQGIPIERIAEEYGTPLYVYDGDVLRRQFTELRERLHPAMEVFYSLKANPNISLCALLHHLGARAEVSSLAELVTARRAGVDPADILFLGPGKTVAEVTACVREGIAAIVCESLDELALIGRIATEAGVVTPVALRVNPGFSVKGAGLAMGGKPRQFGVDEAQLFDLADREPATLRPPGTRLVGIQVYLGTRILVEDSIVDNTRRVLDLATRLSERVGFPLDMVDVGGGLGVAYFDGERDLDVDLLTGKLNEVIEAFVTHHPDTRLVMELGRYLVALAGTYVVRVRYVKTSMGERFAIADGGTNHHMAAVGIGSFVKRNYPITILNRDISGEAKEKWHITGPLCTPNDVIGKGVQLPPPREGDLVGVGRSGAYGSTASPVNFLSHGAPAEVLVDGGQAQLIRRRDTVDDLLRAQHLITPHPDPAPTTSHQPRSSQRRKGHHDHV